MASTKCTADNCPQAVFREGLCIDHHRKKATPGKKLVGAPAASGGGDLSETITDAMRTEFTKLTRKPYAEQAKWYLNAFWAEGAEDQAEDVWDTNLKFTELDARKKAGNELNHVQAHHYLQTNGKTMTALELKAELRRIDVDANGEMALLEYLLFVYRRRVTDVLNNPQGGSGEEVKELAAAQAKLEELMKAVEEARVAEEKAKAAEAEAKAAAAEFARQEQEYKNEIARLEARSTDQSLGQVARNKAAQELAALKDTDPLPLRRAKITQDACVRKVEAARKAAEAATAEAEARANETQAILNELKKRAAVPFGAIWWMEREIKEAKKYMAKSRQ